MPSCSSGGADSAIVVPGEARAPSVADARSRCKSQNGVHGVWGELCLLRMVNDGQPPPQCEGLARDITVRLAHVTDASMVERACFLDFAQRCAAISAMIEAAGVRSRCVGQNVVAYAYRH
eukprot:7633786-Pyramimonas_sp.AAC.1